MASPSRPQRCCSSCRSETWVGSSPAGTTSSPRRTGPGGGGPPCTWTAPGCGGASPSTVVRSGRSASRSTPCTCRSTSSWGACPGPAWPAPGTGWRRRHGGTVHGMWPNAGSALNVLRMRLPRIAAYQEHALAIADALRDLPDVDVVPDPPHTPMMHLVLYREAGPLRSAALRMAREDGIWTWARYALTGAPRAQRAELDVGDATLQLAPSEVGTIVERLI